MTLPTIKVLDRWARSRASQQVSRFQIPCIGVEGSVYGAFFEEGALPPGVEERKWAGNPEMGGPIAVELALNTTGATGGTAGYVYPDPYPTTGAAAIPRTGFQPAADVEAYNACAVVRWSYLGYESAQVIDLDQRSTLILPAADWVTVKAFGNTFDGTGSRPWPEGAVVNVMIRPADPGEKSLARVSLLPVVLAATGSAFQLDALLDVGRSRMLRVNCGFRGNQALGASATVHVFFDAGGHVFASCRFTSEFLLQPAGATGRGAAIQAPYEIAVPAGCLAVRILVNGTASAVVAISAELN